MADTLRFLPPIPDGYRIWQSDLEVAGIRHRKRAAWEFSRGKGQRLLFEPEPRNKHDQNAIKIIGCYSSWWVNWKPHLGYVESEVARELTARGDQRLLCPRLKSIWVGGYHEMVIIIRYDILEPKKK